MENRREFLKRSAYVTPLILSIAVRPALAGGAYDRREEPEPRTQIDPPSRQLV